MSTDPFPSNRELNGRFPLAALPDSNMSVRDDIVAHERAIRDLEVMASTGNWPTVCQCYDRAKLHRIRRLELLRKALA